VDDFLDIRTAYTMLFEISLYVGVPVDIQPFRVFILYNIGQMFSNMKTMHFSAARFLIIGSGEMLNTSGCPLIICFLIELTGGSLCHQIQRI
jgi:hypothetical protein